MRFKKGAESAGLKVEARDPTMTGAYCIANSITCASIHPGAAAGKTKANNYGELLPGGVCVRVHAALEPAWPMSQLRQGVEHFNCSSVGHQVPSARNVFPGAIVMGEYL